MLGQKGISYFVISWSCRDWKIQTVHPVPIPRPRKVHRPHFPNLTETLPSWQMRIWGFDTKTVEGLPAGLHGLTSVSVPWVVKTVGASVASLSRGHDPCAVCGGDPVDEFLSSPSN